MEQARLARALDKVDFHLEAVKACMFAPGIEYRFMAGKDEIALQVCFQCNDLKYYGGGGSDTVDFGPVKAELLDLAKSAFPDLGLQSNAESAALFMQARDLDSRGQTANSIRIYRRAARAGSGKAAARLGEIYDQGINGVPSDKAEAAAWFKTARELGEQVPLPR